MVEKQQEIENLVLSSKIVSSKSQHINFNFRDFKSKTDNKLLSILKIQMKKSFIYMQKK